MRPIVRVCAVVWAMAAAGMALRPAAAAAQAVCTGDCDDDGSVMVGEVVTGVAQALGIAPIQLCYAFDRNADGAVSIDELLAAVRSLLDGCPPAPVPFTAALDADGPALIITSAGALRGEAVYAVVVTDGVTDSSGRSVQASAAFRRLEGISASPGDGPVALYDDDPEADGNPYPDPRLVQDQTVHIPDHFALRGLADVPPLATARAVLRTTADAVGAAGLFSTTAPIRIPLSSAVDVASVTPDSVRVFRRPDRKTDLESLLRQAEQMGIRRDSIALAMSFPTQTVEGGLLDVRGRLDEREQSGLLRVVLTDPNPNDDLAIGVFSRGAPGFPFADIALYGGTTGTTVAEFLAANPDVETVVHGLLPSPDFRGTDGLFDAGKVSGATTADAVLIDFYLTLPASPGPHRVVVVQHGFGGDNSFGLSVAEELARVGYAGIAISAVSHGLRGNFLDLLTSTPLQLRDIFRQTNADQLALVRAVQTGIDVDGDGVSDLDATGLGYLGESLGGILGGTFIAIEPSLQMAVLNVAGGRVAFLGNNPGTRPIFSQYLATEAKLDVASPEFEIFLQRMLELGQQALDPADPLDYARHWRIEPFAGFAPRRVLMQEGIGDLLVSNESTEALAAEGGLVADVAMSDAAGVSGLWRFAPPGGHGIFARPDVRGQAIHYLATNGTEISAPE